VCGNPLLRQLTLDVAEVQTTHELDGVTSETFDCKCLLQLSLGVTEVMGLNWVRLNL
jgi:hypothetical protein